MGIKFLNQNITTNTVRPTGFKFPVGLTVLPGGGPDTVDYLVVAGGGSGGQWGGGGGAGGAGVSAGVVVSGATGGSSFTNEAGGVGGTATGSGLLSTALATGFSGSSRGFCLFCLPIKIARVKHSRKKREPRYQVAF